MYQQYNIMYDDRQHYDKVKAALGELAKQHGCEYTLRENPAGQGRLNLVSVGFTGDKAGNLDSAIASIEHVKKVSKDKTVQVPEKEFRE